MDTSHGPGPGWQAPAKGKTKLWRTPMSKRLRGLGFDAGGLMPADSGYDASTDPASASYSPANDWRNYDIPTGVTSPGTVPAGVTDWSSLTRMIAPISNSADSILKAIFQSQPGTYTRAADGSITYRAPVGSGASMSLPSMGVSGISPLYLGVGVLAFLLMLKAFK